MTIRRAAIRFFLLPLFFVAFPAAGPVFGSSPENRVTQGVAAYNSGDFLKAIELFGEASVRYPESPLIQFDTGLCYYRLDALDDADSLFACVASNREASQALRFKAIYNRGNTAFLESEKLLAAGDLESALEKLRDAALYYRDAADPEIEEDIRLDATHNLEVVQIRIKDLLDKIKQAQEEQERQQERMKRLVEKMTRLINRETGIVKGLSTGLTPPDDVAAIQDTNLVETVEAIDTLSVMNAEIAAAAGVPQGASGGGGGGLPGGPGQMGSPPGIPPGVLPGGAPGDSMAVPTSPFVEVAGLLEEAADNERSVLGELADRQPEEAVEPAENALGLMAEALKKLLENLQSDSGGQQQQQQQQQQQPEGSDQPSGDSGGQQEQQQEPEPEQDQGGENKDEEQQEEESEQRRMNPREAREELAKLRDRYAKEQEEIEKELEKRGYRKKDEHRTRVDMDW